MSSLFCTLGLIFILSFNEIETSGFAKKLLVGSKSSKKQQDKEKATDTSYDEISKGMPGSLQEINTAKKFSKQDQDRQDIYFTPRQNQFLISTYNRPSAEPQAQNYPGYRSNFQGAPHREISAGALDLANRMKAKHAIQQKELIQGYPQQFILNSFPEEDSNQVQSHHMNIPIDRSKYKLIPRYVFDEYAHKMVEVEEFVLIRNKKTQDKPLEPTRRKKSEEGSSGGSGVSQSIQQKLRDAEKVYRKSYREHNKYFPEQPFFGPKPIPPVKHIKQKTANNPFSVFPKNYLEGPSDTRADLQFPLDTLPEKTRLPPQEISRADKKDGYQKNTRPQRSYETNVAVNPPPHFDHFMNTGYQHSNQTLPHQQDSMNTNMNLFNNTGLQFSDSLGPMGSPNNWGGSNDLQTMNHGFERDASPALSPLWDHSGISGSQLNPNDFQNYDQHHHINSNPSYPGHHNGSAGSSSG